MGEIFVDWMREEVEPYLKARCQYGYLQGRDGTQIHYNRYRVPDAEKCVVICHGFCEFAEKYNEVIYYMLRAGYSVYIPEHRGHGYSDRKAADAQMVHVESYQEYVEDFVRFVRTVAAPKEEHRFLLAHSMGGAIAALAIEQNPELFEAAVFSAPMWGMQTGRYPRIVAQVTAFFYCMAGKGAHYAAGQSGFCRRPDFAGSSCTCEERYRYIFEKRLGNVNYQTYGGSYAWVLAGLRATRRLMKKGNLSRIETPILLFAAGHDHMVDNHAIELFAERTGNTQLVFMPESRHEIFNADEKTRRKSMSFS